MYVEYFLRGEQWDRYGSNISAPCRPKVNHVITWDTWLFRKILSVIHSFLKV